MSVPSGSVSPFRLEVLGPVRVTATDDGDARVSLISQPRRLALLAYLSLCRPHRLHSRDVLLALLWPESSQNDGRHALRNALHAIRKALSPDVIVSEGDALIGIDRSVLLCDANVLENEISRGAALAPNRLECELMEGFHVAGAPQFERWMDAERRRFEEVVISALWQVADSLDRNNDQRAAIAVARSARSRAPHDERSLRRIIELLDKNGDAAAAIVEYDSYASALDRDFGVAPSPAVMQLASDVRARHATGNHPARVIRKSVPTNDASTYIQYVRGTYLFLRSAHSGDVNDLQQCRVLFESALERDPTFGLAYAGLANYFAVAAARNVLRPFETTFARAIELSHRALEFDLTLAIPHVHFGVKAMYLDHDWNTAGEEFSLAVALDPSYAEARRFLGIWYDVTGRPEDALRELREAVRLEPHIAMFRNTLAAALMDRGEWLSAMSELERALELDPGYMAARERLIRCLEECGLYEKAIIERTRAPVVGEVSVIARAFETEGVPGYRHVLADEMRSQMIALETRISTDMPVNAGDLFSPPELRLAILSARLGDWEAASRWEESACVRRPGLEPWFTSRPELVRSRYSARQIPG